MKRIKSAVCTVVLTVLYRGLRYLNEKDSRMKAGFSSYADGTVFRIRTGMKNNSPALTFSCRGGRLIKESSDIASNLEITFKSISDAFLVLTGQTGVAAAYAQHRFYLRGNPNEAVSLVSCMELAESYLFPPFMSRRLMLAVPEKELSVLKVYAALLRP